MKNPLSEKAMLANVHIRRWTGRRLDRTVTEEVNSANEAEGDAGRYNKQLIRKVAFEEVNAATRGARQAHYALTLPWTDEGRRLLPAEQFDKFRERMRNYRADFDKAADKFAKDYPEHVRDQKRLGKMFKHEDYPDAKSIRGMFDFNIRMEPVGEADFRCKLTSEQLKELRTDTEAWMKDALGEAMKDPVNRIVDVVGHMVERLNAFKPGSKDKSIKASGTFRDSLVTNVAELVELLPAFNLTGDANLTKLTAKMKELCAVNATVLREDDRVRKKTAKSAQDILAAAQKLLA